MKMSLHALPVQEHVICRGEPMCSPAIGNSICKGILPLGGQWSPGRHTGLPLQKLHKSASLKIIIKISVNHKKSVSFCVKKNSIF
jgi:hypothetical protein